MSALAFVPIDEPGVQLLQSWFADDELQRRYDRPTDSWLEYVRSRAGVKGEGARRRTCDRVDWTG